MEIRRRLRRIGNSLMVAILSQVVDDLKLKAGDYVLLDVKDSTIPVRKQGRYVKRWRTIFSFTIDLMFVRLRRRVDSKKKWGVCLDSFPSERQNLSLVVSG